MTQMPDALHAHVVYAIVFPTTHEVANAAAVRGSCRYKFNQPVSPNMMPNRISV